MCRRTSLLHLCAMIVFLCIQPGAVCQGDGITVGGRSETILWREPTDIGSRNLYDGPGGPQGQPKPPFKFVKEDLAGTSPKFDVKDGAGSKWRVKLGPEAQPETAATRLLWAVGFVANKNYFVPEMQVKGMPSRLKRGQKLIGPNGELHSVRLQQAQGGKRLGTWKWKSNPFTGTREFNGLRVMMALLSNWDLKDDNNAIHADPEPNGSELYEVSDVGASFGRTGETYSASASKNNLQAYRRSKFISKITRDYVNFNFPTHLPYLYVFDFPLFFSQRHLHWIGQHIPRADAEWMGSLLAELSPQQIRDAFRAAVYSPTQVEAYATAVQARIAQLQRL